MRVYWLLKVTRRTLGFVVDEYCVSVERYRVASSDLHEETCQQGFLNVEGVASGTEGGH